MRLERTDILSKLREVRSVAKQPAYSSIHLQIGNFHKVTKGSINDKGIRIASEQNPFFFDLLETDRIFHIEQIKKICIDYRLRFLDLKYFKSALPVEAHQHVEKLEYAHEMELKGLKIIAPSKLFKLEDKDDPLLFAPMGNDYYYLVHKWGNDLHPLRKWLMWPFKNMINLTLVVFIISYLFSLMIPMKLFTPEPGLAEFLILFFFTFKSLAAVVIFYGFALGKNFNPAIWNSKYFNA